MRLVSSRLSTFLILLAWGFCSACSVPGDIKRSRSQSLRGAMRSLENGEVRAVLVYFWSPGCVPCRVFEKRVLESDAFALWVRDFAFAKVREGASPEAVRVSRKLAVEAIPSVVVLQADNSPVTAPLGSGLSCGISCLTPESFIDEIEQILAKEVQ